MSAPLADPSAAFRLDGKVAVLTGASSGIGDRFARVLHAAGATVVLAARRKDRLDALAADLPGSVPVACDVSRDSDLENLVAVALDVSGRIDVVVNNAGITEPTPAHEETPDQFRRVVDVNLNGLYALCHLVAPSMLAAASGVIVNVASIMGIVGAGQIPQASYAASKGAVVNLTRELAAQWARRGIRVNAIAPGFFETEMTAEMFESPEAGHGWIKRKTPMGREGRLEELDGALLFLASDASTYVTGHVLCVDGGWTAV